MILPIQQKWFDMILELNPDFRKIDEYREKKPYWGVRFANILGFNSMEELDHYLSIHGESKHFEVTYRNGYSRDSRTLTAKVTLALGTGRPEWGAEPDKQYYVLQIWNVEFGGRTLDNTVLRASQEDTGVNPNKIKIRGTDKWIRQTTDKKAANMDIRLWRRHNAW